MIGSCVLACAAAGCGDLDFQSGAVGAVSFTLSVPDGVRIDGIDYAITGESLTKHGNVPVGGDRESTFVKTVAGIPAATGYELALEAHQEDSDETCTGAAHFDVTEDAVTEVAVKLQCGDAPTDDGGDGDDGAADAGGDEPGGTVDPPADCAIKPVAMAVPAADGKSVSLKGSCGGSTASPKFSWTAQDGALSAESGSEVVLSCPPRAVRITVDLTVSSGSCHDRVSVSAACGATQNVCSPAASALNWTDWKTADTQASHAEGTAVTSDGSIDVAYTGEVALAGTQGSPYFAFDAFRTAAVPTEPNGDFVGLVGGAGTGTHALTFSKPVRDPYMAIISLGQPGVTSNYVFDAPFTILSQGGGSWGAGTLSTPDGLTLVGTEGNGVIRFQGTLSRITWTIPVGDNWNGFTVGF
jgi:hypothetical protein